MPAVVRRMVLLYSNAWKECSHFFTEGTGCLGEQLSAALHPRGHHFLNGGMDRDNPGFSGPALISALEIPFRGIDLYFAVLLDSEPGQAHNPEHFGHVVLSGRIDGLEIVNGERNALLIVIRLFIFQPMTVIALAQIIHQSIVIHLMQKIDDMLQAGMF